MFSTFFSNSIQASSSASKNEVDRQLKEENSRLKAQLDDLLDRIPPSLWKKLCLSDDAEHVDDGVDRKRASTTSGSSSLRTSRSSLSRSSCSSDNEHQIGSATPS